MNPLPPNPHSLQIAGGMLNGVSPNYRDMAPALQALTSISYNRCRTCVGAAVADVLRSVASFPTGRDCSGCIL